MQLELREPEVALVPSYLDFIDEMRALGEKIWESIVPEPGESPAAFVARIEAEKNHPLAGLVACTTFWAVVDGEVAGRISFRHELNENLREFGGHIGYEVRPSLRRRGIAKEMLRLTLETPLARSIGRLLLTCAPNNIASNRTILANGGKLTATKFVAKWQRDTNYYWIDLTAKK